MTSAEQPILPITVIGSYPKPKYLKLTDWFMTGHVRTGTAAEKFGKEMRETDAAEMEKNLLRATREIFEEQAGVGVDIPTDGEVRRENYVYTFCRGLEGISFDPKDYTTQNLRGTFTASVPTVVGKIRSRTGSALAVDEWRAAQCLSSTPVKITLPGPMTICDTIAVDHIISSGTYSSRQAICADIVPILKKEVAALVDAGCKHIQVDEPVFARRVEEALDYGVANLSVIFEDVPKSVTRTVHLCCGYPNKLDDMDYKHAPKENYIRLAPALDVANVDWISLEDAHCKNDLGALLPLFKNKTIVFGSICNHRSRVETVQEIQERIEEALTHIPAERLALAPDCGLGFLPVSILLAKMRNLQIARDTIRKRPTHAMQDAANKKCKVCGR